LRTAGLRLQQCLACAYESERFASFQRQCANGCDKGKLSLAFERSSREFVDKTLSLAGIASPGTIGRQWQVEENGGRGTWTRRGVTPKETLEPVRAEDWRLPYSIPR
jgi:hypothetical protein